MVQGTGVRKGRGCTVCVHVCGEFECLTMEDVAMRSIYSADVRSLYTNGRFRFAVLVQRCLFVSTVGRCWVGARSVGVGPSRLCCTFSTTKKAPHKEAFGKLIEAITGKKDYKATDPITEIKEITKDDKPASYEEVNGNCLMNAEFCRIVCGSLHAGKGRIDADF